VIEIHVVLKPHGWVLCEFCEEGRATNDSNNFAQNTKPSTASQWLQKK